MDAQQFAYWLQGFAELNSQPPTAEQWESIREHLAMVFKKITPIMGSPKIPDLKDSDEIKRLLDKAKRENFIQPYSPPYQPYFLDGRDGMREPGVIYC